MKKTTKIAGLAAGLFALIGTTFTSCDLLSRLGNSFGKDDFNGTWLTLDFDSAKDPIPFYHGSNGNYYAVRWDFDGTSENATAKGGLGEFRQHLINYGNTAPQKEIETGTDEKGNETRSVNYTYGSVNNETYWFGCYDIRGNSSYSKGKLFLEYQVGFDIDDAIKNKGATVNKDNDLTENKSDPKSWVIVTGGNKTYSKATADDIVAVLDTWKLEDFLNYAYDNNDGLDNLKTTNTALHTLAYNANDSQTNCGGTNKATTNYVTVQVRYDSDNKKILCSDIEYFRFNLKDATADGYCRMMDTVYGKDTSTMIGGIYNQWASEADAVGTDTGKSISLDGSKAYRVYEGTSWTGANIRYMGRIHFKSTPAEPKWLYSTNDKDNSSFFKLDEKDETDYLNPEAIVNDDETEK